MTRINIRRIACSALIAGILSASFGFAADELSGRTPPREATSVAINKAFPSDGATDVQAWVFEVQALGARYVRLEFGDIQDSTTGDYEVVIFNGSLNRVATYSKAQFSKEKTFWSPIVHGGYARVMVLMPDGGVPSGLKYRIVQYLYESPTAALESIRDENDPKLRPVSAYSGDAALQLAARSVAKLRNVGRDGVRVCTGFMIGRDLMLTNEHCVPDKGICARMLAYFDWDPQREDESNLFRCAKLERVNADLDIALVRLDGNAGDTKAWGRLRLDAREPQSGQKLYIIQYPGVREPKQVARDGCTLTKPAAPGVKPDDLSDFGHTCDTKQGSSGSPVFTLDNHVIGLHHWGFDTDPEWNYENRAVRMKAILSAIADLIK